MGRVRSRSNQWSGRLAVGLAVAVASLLAPVAASAATFSVTRSDDPAPGACDSDCSLREAVRAANAGLGGDTISVPPGIYRLTIPGQNEDAAATGDLNLAKNVTVIGAGAHTTAVDAMETDRVFKVETGVTAQISGVTVTGGSVDGDGGGIANRGALTLTGVIVRGNRAGDASSNHSGGGIDTTSSMTVIDSTIAGNRAYDGGGINLSGSLAVRNSTISGNTAGGRNNNGTGGGIDGGAGATLSITSSTIAYNESFNAVGSGAGIDSPGTTLKNSIVANNVEHDQTLTMTLTNNCGPTPTSQGHNLSDGTDCNLTASGDQQGAAVDPKLGPLGANGGPTDTHALLPGSAAVDAGDGAACGAADQRGVARPQGPVCDIGAFELEVPLPPALPTPPLAMSTAAPRSMSLARFRRGVVARAEPSVSAALRFELLVTARGATIAARNNLMLASRSLGLAAGRRSVRLKPGRKLVGRPRRTFTATVRVTATDAAGRRVVRSSTVKVKVKRRRPRR